MSRQALKSEVPLNESNISKVMSAIEDLLDTHSSQINDAIEDSDDRKIVVNFTLDINAADSAPAIDVKCRFTPCTVTDKRSLQCDDPNQARIFSPEEEDNVVKGSSRARAKAEAKAARKATELASDVAAQLNVNIPKREKAGVSA